MDYKNILFEITDNIGVITLNRPDEANSIHKPMVEELADIVLVSDTGSVCNMHLDFLQKKANRIYMYFSF